MNWRLLSLDAGGRRAQNVGMGIAKLLVIPWSNRWRMIHELLEQPLTLGSERRVLDLLRSLGVEKLTEIRS